MKNSRIGELEMEQEQIKEIIEKLDTYLKDINDETDSKINSAGRNAPQSYLDDMNGCSRGMSIIRFKTIEFLKEQFQI